jgi:hypothetical protein
MFHNQWQVGEFVTQKQLKVGGEGAFKFVPGTRIVPLRCYGHLNIIK